MHSGHSGGVLLAALSFVLQLGCSEPDCPEGTRKIGISCVPLRALGDAGAHDAGGRPDETADEAVDAGPTHLDASADAPASLRDVSVGG